MLAFVVLPLEWQDYEESNTSRQYHKLPHNPLRLLFHFQ